MIATTSAISRLRTETAEALRPRQRPTAATWIADRIRLSEEFETARGPYDLASRPWWRDILEAACNPNVRSIRLKAAPQLGKTLALSALLCYLAENSPASSMVVLPDRDSATEFRDRLYALAKESQLYVPPPWRWNTRHCDIGDMRVYLAWPKSRQRLRGRRCKYVFRSEIDVYESVAKVGDPIESSNQRTKGFARYLTLDESSPIPEPSRIDRLEKQSRQHRWHGRCPHCGLWQPIKFFPDRSGRGGVVGFVGPDNQFLDPDDAERTAYYACEAGCTIDNNEKPAFVLGGRWVAGGVTLDVQGESVGTPDKPERELGYHMWAAMTGDTWGQIAREYVRGRAAGTLADVFQNTLGLSFKSRAKMPTWRELGARLAGSHQRGTIPAQAWFLTAGADVQDREVYCTLRAWGGEKTSWLVDWFVFERDVDDENALVKSDLAQINEAVLRKAWPVLGENPRGQTSLRVLLLAIDANHRTLDVHAWMQSLGETRRVRAVRGDQYVKPSDKYRPTLVRRSKRDGVEYSGGGLELWGINPDVFRVDLANRFNGTQDKPGAWYVTADCLELGEWYLKQVVNEPQVLERGKDGRARVVWKERDATIGHDFWDCEVYASAAAEMVVDQFDNRPGWNADRWPRPGRDMTDAAPAWSQQKREFE